MLDENDFVLIVGMVLTMILFNAMIGAADLTDESVKSTDIPQYNVSGNSFNFAGERPEAPLGPDEHRISHNATGLPKTSDLNGTTQAQATGPICTYGIQTGIGVTGGNQENKVGDEEGDVVRIEVENWIAVAELQNTTHCIWDGEVLESPGGGSGFLEGFIGDTGSAIAGLFAAGVFLVETLFWGFLGFVSIIFNLGGTIVGIGQFVISLMGWLFVSYTTNISAVGGWVRLPLTIPIVVLSYESAKIILTVIDVSNWI